MIPGSANPLLLKSAAAAAGGYQIERSLRFNSSDSAYLSRTPAVAGNRQTWTWAGWVKRSAFGSDQMIFTSRPTASPYALFYFTSADYLQFTDNTLGYIRTASVFRDPSAWYHILLSVDTTGATAADYLKIYVNNVRQTIGASTLPSQNSEGQINTATAHSIGSFQPYAGTEYFNGYLAECYLIDGQQLTPSSFTEVSATTGQLIPKAYTGSYGTNGFQLKFADNSSNTATTLGKDTSGNGNNWTPNNLSVTAGAGNDSLVDTPTSYGMPDTGVGGEVRGNYATLNPLDLADFTLSNGNLNYSKTSTTWKSVRATVGVNSGKWYYEYQFGSDSRHYIGISQSSMDIATYPGATSTSYSIYLFNGYKSNNGVDSSYASAFTSTDILGVAFDLDAATVTFYKNGTSLGTAFTGIASGYYFPTFGTYISGETGTVNFGQRPFAYTAPSGFKALCDTNLPAPVVAKPSTVFDVITYTGTGSSLTLPNGSSTPTSISFTPDFAWLKGRSGATNHALYDAVRGVQKDLVSNSNAAETTQTTGLTAFGTNTFTVGSLAKLNTSSSTYVAWAWNAGGSTVSNTTGSIASQVRANVSAGFSVVTYTGNGSGGATFGHGLGVAPKLVIFKCRTDGYDWLTYHGSLPNTTMMALNTTGGPHASGRADFLNSTDPSSTVVTLGSTVGVNDSQPFVAYCFAPVVGYSSFGSYTGNGSSDGVFVYTGFRPRWIMIKGYVGTAASTANWLIIDASRDTYNVSGYKLAPNLADAENSVNIGTFANNSIDILSNGFKNRSTNGSSNDGSTSYIYAAFAENPFQYARAR